MNHIKRQIFLGLTISAILLLSSFQSNAQKAEIGFRFMPTFSSLNLKTSSGGNVTGKATLGYGVGAVLGFFFTEHVGVQGEIIYSTITQKYTEVERENTVNLKYINIPLLLSLNTGITSRVNLNAVIGPQIGLNVGSSVSTQGAEGTSYTQAIVSVKKSDLGFAYGAGLDFSLNPSNNIRLGVGYRGVYGLFDISNNNKTAESNSFYVVDKTHIKTNSLYLGLSFLF